MSEQGFPIDAEWHPQLQSIVLWWVIAVLLFGAGIFAFAGCLLCPPKLWRQRLLAGLVLVAPIIGAWLSTVNSQSQLGPSNIGAATFGLWTVCIGGLIVSHIRTRRAGHQPTELEITFFSIGLATAFTCLWSAAAGGHPREASRRSQCRNNMKMLGLAAHNLWETNGRLPQSASGEVPMSWRIASLPYLDGSDHFERYDQSQAWDSPKNAPIAQSEFAAYMCSARWTARKDEHGRYFTDYIMPTGEGTLSNSKSQRIEEITDGASNTLLLTEASGLRIIWTEPRDHDITREPIGINLKGTSAEQSPGMISSYHREGANVLLADGDVRFLSEKTDPTVVKQLAHISDGEPKQVPE